MNTTLAGLLAASFLVAAWGGCSDDETEAGPGGTGGAAAASAAGGSGSGAAGPGGGPVTCACASNGGAAMTCPAPYDACADPQAGERWVDADAELLCEQQAP